MGYSALCPLERGCVLIVGDQESVDRLTYLSRRSEASVAKHPAGENTEPHLNLIQPTGVCWGEVKMYVLVAGKPLILRGRVFILEFLPASCQLAQIQRIELGDRQFTESEPGDRHLAEPVPGFSYAEYPSLGVRSCLLTFSEKIPQLVTPDSGNWPGVPQ